MEMSSPATESLNLVFDADDTLWDSNIHFLEAFDHFAAAVGDAELGISRIEIHAAVRRAEITLIKTHGYGRRPYVIALHQAAAELAPAGHDGLRDEIEHIGAHLLERECALLPDVEPTLQELAQRHRLLMFTKGQRDEQLQKLARSGLGPLFDRLAQAFVTGRREFRRRLMQRPDVRAATVAVRFDKHDFGASHSGVNLDPR